MAKIVVTYTDRHPASQGAPEKQEWSREGENCFHDFDVESEAWLFRCDDSMLIVSDPMLISVSFEGKNKEEIEKTEKKKKK